MKCSFHTLIASKYAFTCMGIAGFLHTSGALAVDSFEPATAPVLPSQNQQLAQQPTLPEERPNPRLDEQPPSRQPLPEFDPGLPPLDDLLELPGVPDTPMPRPELAGDRICVVRFEVTGSTVYETETLAQIAADAVFPELPDCPLGETEDLDGYSLTFADLQQARDAITQYYVEDGYVTSGAFIPEQTLETGIVQLQIIEGRVEEIEVQGLERLHPAYVRDRIALAAQPPLNSENLLQGLQLLQLDPLIENIDVELAAWVQPGTNRLVANVSEANPYRLSVGLDNGRTPLVGSLQRRIRGGHLNLLGQGDRFFMDYVNTDGSNSVDLSYTYPLNARNGTLSLSHGRTSSWVIEEDFEILDIRSRSQYYELTYRQPLYQTPTQEFALSLTGSHQRSESRFNPGGFADLPFPTRGSDEDGKTRISALRFSQDWLKRDSRQVLALRSQFSLGVNAFGATQNPTSPDSNFFSWRGQGQWVYLLGPDALLQLRSDLQFADRPLLPQEQIGLGGFGSVRGYRQDQLLTDNGWLASAEVRVPIARVPEVDGLLQVIPFIDFGLGWNESGENPDPNNLLAAGLGLGWQMEGGFTARLDYGFPLIDVPDTGNSWQENGITFSVRYEPF